MSALLSALAYLSVSFSLFRDYQKKDAKLLWDTIDQGFTRILFEACVGYGKSLIIQHLAIIFCENQKNVLILSNRTSVVEQLQKRTNGYSRITTSTIQSIVNKLEKILAPDIILVDEAHMGGRGKQYLSVFERFPDAIVVEFTGTPSPEMFDILDKHIEGHSAQWLTDNSYLSPLQYATAGKAKIKDALKKIRSHKDDYVLEDLTKLMDQKHISGNAISSYAKYCLGKPTLVFCCTIEHAENVAREFRVARHPCETLTSKDKKRDIPAKIDYLKTGGLLITVDKVSAGFDLPDLFAIISLRPTKSPRVWVQQMGRVARISEGKFYGYVFDHANNTMGVGTLTEKRNWRNPDEDAKSKRDVDGNLLSIRTCEKCFKVFSSEHSTCPICNHENRQDRRISVKEKEHIDFIAAKDIEKARQEAADKRKKEESGEKTLQDWLNIAKERGYKPGWAHHRHKLRNQRQRPTKPRYRPDGRPL